MANLSSRTKAVSSYGFTFAHIQRFEKKEPYYLLPEKYRLENFSYGQEIRNINKFVADTYNKLNKNQIKILSKKKLRTDVKLFQEELISFGYEQYKNCNKEEFNKKLVKYAKERASKMNVQFVRLDAHFDEGRIDINSGEVKYNIHAHIIYENVNMNTGLTVKKRTKQKDLRENQDLLASYFESLGFKRGISKLVKLQTYLDNNNITYNTMNILF